MMRCGAPGGSHTGTRSFTASGAHSSVACPFASRTSARQSPSAAATVFAAAPPLPPPRIAVTMPTPACAVNAAPSPCRRATSPP